MPTIRPDRSRFRAEIRLSGHPSLSRNFETRDAAEIWARETEKELRAGDQVDTRRRTLADVIKAYLSSSHGEHLGAHERKVLAWWRKELGRRRLQNLKRGDFYAARDRIRGADDGHLAPATLNRRMAAIAAVLTMAMDRDWISWNPARIRRLTEHNARERLLSPDERNRLLEACRASTEPDLHPLVICAMLSGGRAGELVRLTWGDVDLENGIGRLAKTKTRVRRPIPLRGRAAAALREIAARRPGGTADHVFQHADGRAPFEYTRAWRAARATAGVEDVRFHDLRHLAASELAMAGTSTRELQHLLGHASAQMTARYSHFVDDHTAELGDRLHERLFGEAESK